MDTDIWIIALATFGVFLFYAAMSGQLMGFVKDTAQPVILRLMQSAGVQFGLAGLGISIVCVLRKEKFSSFGLVKKNTLRAVAGSATCFVPYIVYVFAAGKFEGYRPFGILIADDVLKSGFPLNVLGMALIVVVC